MMDAPVGHIAAGIVEPPAEIPADAFGTERNLGRLAEPEVEIEFLGRLGILERSARGGGAHRGLRLELFAQPAASCDGHGFEETTAEHAPLLRAHLEDAVGSLHRLADHTAFVDRQRQRFFAVDVLAGRQRVDGDLDVPMVGHADDDRLHVLAIEHLVVVLIDLTFAADLFSVGEVVGVAQVDVGAGDHAAEPCRLFADFRAASADADGGDDEFVALRLVGRGGGGEVIGRGHARSRYGRGGLQKITASVFTLAHGRSPLWIASK